MALGETVRDVLVGGGFFAGVAAVVAALLSSGDARHSRTLQSYEQERTVQVQVYEKTLQSRQQMCAAALSYLEDEKPNPTLTPEQRQLAFDSVNESLRNCGRELPQAPGLSYRNDEQLALPSAKHKTATLSSGVGQ